MLCVTTEANVNVRCLTHIPLIKLVEQENNLAPSLVNELIHQRFYLVGHFDCV